MRMRYWHPLFGSMAFNHSDNFTSINILCLVRGLEEGRSEAIDNIHKKQEEEGEANTMMNKGRNAAFLPPQRSNVRTESGNLGRSTSLVLSKSPCIEYPSAPNPSQGETVVLSCHAHPLAQIFLSDPFTCMGCKEYGAGSRFTCQQCNYQVHEFCALAPATLKTHPLHCQHPLVFCSKPVKGGILGSKCGICNKAAAGYTYRCNACSFQIHPCCAMLSSEMSFAVHPHPLSLMPAMSTAGGGEGAGFSCGECKRKRSGRVYRCSGAPSCDYHLHAVCAKNMVNGLRASGITSLEKPSMLGAAAKIASQVVIEFIGGLIEGLGQGVGDVLVQTITRGRCSTRAQRTRLE